MCGRFTITFDLATWEQNFHVAPPNEFHPNYNSAPSQDLPVITNDDPKHAQLFRWGLIPFWAKDSRIGYRMINARAETIAEKPSFVLRSRLNDV